LRALAVRAPGYCVNALGIAPAAATEAARSMVNSFGGERSFSGMAMDRVNIRPVFKFEEFQACEGIQLSVWGTLGVGTEVLSVTQKYGGLVLGALAGGKVVGFIYAFLARYKGRLIHWSHMMAVAAEYRNQGVGFRMKLTHRRLALSQGLRAICWTYDPLQSRNATLNLHRLGAQGEEYIPDCYGPFASLIEKGLPSDRFVVNWRIGTARVKQRLLGKRPTPDLSFPQVNETCRGGQGFLENRSIRVGLTGPRLLVEIPGNTDEMREHDLALASRWRMETRRIFRRYFSAGYVAEDFIPPSPASDNRCYYLLRLKPGRRSLEH
jgi:predicted GNAT superfamily acetyltransferase